MGTLMYLCTCIKMIQSDSPETADYLKRMVTQVFHFIKGHFLSVQYNSFFYKNNFKSIIQLAKITINEAIYINIKIKINLILLICSI